MYNNFSSKKTKKVISALLATALVATSAPISADAATAKVVGVGKTITYNAKAKVKKVTVKNKKIVTAKKSGKKVTIKGKKAGKTTVTIKTTKKTIKLTVKVGATKITKKAVTTSMVAGTTKALKVNAVNGKGDTIKFTSSNKSTVKVNKASAKANSKKVAGTTVTALKAGTAKIKATSKYTGKSKTFTITVVDATPTVTPSTNPAIVATTPAATANTNPGTNPGGSTTNAPQTTSGAATTAPGSTDVANTTVPGSTDVAETPAASAEATAEATIAPSFDPVTAKEGTLTVTTNVSGASIKVISGGATVASLTMNALETSATTTTLQPGVYTVEITKKGYDKKTETVVIDGNKTLNVSLTEEVVLGASATVTNSLIEYDNTVLVNDNAIVTVTVKDKNGNLVPNKTVVFSANRIDPACADIEVKGQNVQTTDANGRASFVVGLKTTTTDSTDTSSVTSADFTAKVLDVTDGTNSTVSGCVGFAALNLGTVSLDEDSEDDLVLGSNAKAANYGDTDGLAKTKSLNGTNNVDYISTQQVSSEGTKDHELTFNVAPKIKLPTMSTTASEAKEFVQSIPEKDGVSGKYSTYATTEYNHVVELDEETTNLEYATLIFESVQLSKYTKMEIDAYDTKDSTKFSAATLVDHYEIEGEHEQNNFGYQIPVSKDVKAIRVSLKSAGQIQIDKNDGYKMTKIQGIYKSATKTAGEEVAISTAKVNWEVVNPTMSNMKELTVDDAVDLLGITPSDKEDTDTPAVKKTTQSTFKYQVPAFPNTGDAVIVEYENSKVVAYYMAPTENERFYRTDGVTGYVAYQNRNEIKALAEKVYWDGKQDEGGNWLEIGDPTSTYAIKKENSYNAYKATEAEATTVLEAGITQTGNSVTVNSEKVGRTNLKGTISLPALGGDVLDDSNRYVYTSVQWNPIPDEEVASTSDAFLALAGQNVTVYAQLIDKNNNPVSEKDVTVTYKCSDQASANGITFETGSALNKINDVAIVKNAKTDVNGRATLVLNASVASVLDDLSASSKDYKVRLYIGDKTATQADIYWLNADLEFQKSVNAPYGIQRTNGTTEKAETNAAKVNTDWEYAVKTVGNKFVSEDASSASYEKEFKYPGTLENADITIKGLNVNTTFDDDNKGTYKVVGNGVVQGASSYIDTDTISYAIDETSVNKDVTFIADFGTEEKEYTCVGEGTPNLNAVLNLQTKWEAGDTKLNMITPLGTTVSKDTVTVKVKVSDETGKNPLAKDVYFQSNNGTLNSGLTADMDGDGTNDSVKDRSTVANHGVVAITLKREKGTTSTVLTASIKGVDQVASTTINWVDGEYNPGLVNAAISTEDAKKLVLTSNNKINPDTVKADMFTVKGVNDDKVYEVTDASASGKYITLTLKNALKADEYTVTADKYTSEDGIDYEVADIYGNTIDSRYNKINFYSEGKASFNANVTDNADGTATVEITNIKSPISADSANDGVDDSEAKTFAENYLRVVAGNQIAELKVADTDISVTKIGSATGADVSIKDWKITFKVPRAVEDTKVTTYLLGSIPVTKESLKDTTNGFKLNDYEISADKSKVTFDFNQVVGFRAPLDGDALKTLISSTDDNIDSVDIVSGNLQITFAAAITEGAEITIPANVLSFVGNGENAPMTIKMDTTGNVQNFTVSNTIPAVEAEKGVYKLTISSDTSYANDDTIKIGDVTITFGSGSGEVDLTSANTKELIAAAIADKLGATVTANTSNITYNVSYNAGNDYIEFEQDSASETLADALTAVDVLNDGTDDNTDLDNSTVEVATSPVEQTLGVYTFTVNNVIPAGKTLNIAGVPVAFGDDSDDVDVTIANTAALQAAAIKDKLTASVTVNSTTYSVSVAGATITFTQTGTASTADAITASLS